MTDTLPARVETWTCEYCEETYASYQAMLRCGDYCGAGID